MERFESRDNNKFQISNMNFHSDLGHAAERFQACRAALQEKLANYRLDLYFLNDFHRRGPGTIRANLESFGFEHFTPATRQTGGQYLAYSKLFTVGLSFLHLNSQ